MAEWLWLQCSCSLLCNLLRAKGGDSTVARLHTEADGFLLIGVIAAYLAVVCCLCVHRHAVTAAGLELGLLAKALHGG